MDSRQRAAAQHADYLRKQQLSANSGGLVKESGGHSNQHVAYKQIYPDLTSPPAPKPNEPLHSNGTNAGKPPSDQLRPVLPPGEHVAISINPLSSPRALHELDDGSGHGVGAPAEFTRTRSAPVSSPEHGPLPTPARTSRVTWSQTLRDLGVGGDLDSDDSDTDDKDIAAEELRNERYSKCKAYTGTVVKYAASTFVSIPTALNAAKSAVSASVEKITWDWLWNQATFGQGTEVANKFFSSLFANLFVAADYGKQFVFDVFPLYYPSRFRTEPKLFLFDLLLLTNLAVTADIAQYAVNHEGWTSIADDPAAYIFAVLSAIPVFASRFLGPRRIAHKLFGLMDEDVIFTKELVDKLNRIGELHIPNINQKIKHAFIIEKLIKQGYYSEKPETKNSESKKSEQPQQAESKPNKVSAYFSDAFAKLRARVGWNAKEKSKENPKKTEKPKVKITVEEMESLERQDFCEVSKALYPDDRSFDESRCRAIQQVIEQGIKEYERNEFDDLVMERSLHSIDTYIRDAEKAIQVEFVRHLEKKSVRQRKKNPSSQEKNDTHEPTDFKETNSSKVAKASENPSKPRRRKKNKRQPVLRERTPNERRFDKQYLELDIVMAVCVGLCSNTVWLEKLNMGLPNAIRYITLDQVDGMVKEAMASIMASPHTLLYANAALEFRELLTDTLKTLVKNPARLLEFLTLSNFNVWASYSLERLGKSAFSNPQRLLQTFGINPEVDSLFTRLKTWTAIKGAQFGAFFVNINSYFKTFKGAPGLHGLSVFIRREKQSYGKALQEFDVKEVEVKSKEARVNGTQTSQQPHSKKQKIFTPKYPHLFERRPSTLGAQPLNVQMPVATPVMSHSVAADKQPLRTSSAFFPRYGATGSSVEAPPTLPSERSSSSPAALPSYQNGGRK